MQNESLDQQTLGACRPSPVQISRQCSLFEIHHLSSAAFPGKPKNLYHCSSGEKSNTWGPWPLLKLGRTCSQEKCQLLLWFRREQWVMLLLLGYPWSWILFSSVGLGCWDVANQRPALWFHIKSNHKAQPIIQEQYHELNSIHSLPGTHCSVSLCLVAWSTLLPLDEFPLGGPSFSSHHLAAGRSTCVRHVLINTRSR